MGAAYSAGEQEPDYSNIERFPSRQKDHLENRRVDVLYSSFTQTTPDVFRKHSKKHRFLVRKKNKTSGINKLLNAPDNHSPHTQENWMILTLKDLKRPNSVCSSEESEEPELYFEQDEVEDILPVLCDPSQLLDEEHLKSFADQLPARTQGYPWRLAYSTAVHGTSLKTLYREMSRLDCPVLLVVKDMHNKVFGAFSSDPFRVSSGCYGTGETFLYSFSPEFQVYRWSGENYYFVRGHRDCLQIGGGGGRFGLWLDADLHRGSSFSCHTFQNQPLSTQEDFFIQDLEVWTVQ